MTVQKATGFDFEALRRALERNDADDARMSVVDRTRPPSSPLELRTKEEIAGLWRDVCDREMTHRIVREVVGEERVAFHEEYEDGTRVLSAMTLDVRDGRILRHLTVQAWDEESCVTG